jgi:hypothetical protein
LASFNSFFVFTKSLKVIIYIISKTVYFENVSSISFKQVIRVGKFLLYKSILII